MSYFAKRRIIHYKNYKIDIWGVLRNNLQSKKDRTSYNCDGLFYEAKLAERQGFIKKSYYKWNKFIVYNTVASQRRVFLTYARFIHRNRLKSICCFYLLFYFFRTIIKNSIRRVYKIVLKKRRRFNKRYFRTPFLYEPRTYNKIYKRSKASALRLSMQLIRLFYIMYTYKQLKKLIKKAKRSNDTFGHAFILLMECKLPSFIYRSSFFSNMFESIDFVKGDNLWINKKMVTGLHYVVKVTDFIGFLAFLKGFIFWSFFKRLRRKAFLFSYPKYMYVSLIFFLIIFIRLPLKKEIINSITVDVQRVSHYV